MYTVHVCTCLFLPSSEFLEADPQSTMVMCLFAEWYVEETLGDGKGTLVYSRGNSSLKQHLQELAVSGMHQEALAQ